MVNATGPERDFPISAGILFGLGRGGSKIASRSG